MRASLRPVMKRIAAMALLAGSVSCGNVRQDRTPVIIVIDTLQAASGADPASLGSFLLSDVQTLVTQDVGGVSVRVPVIFNDTGQVTMHIIAKDAGTGAANLAPTPLNAITLNRYHINFIRADGRNTPGLDVPFPIDGALTATVSTTPVTVGFELIRHQMKLEQPLRSLASGGSRVFISTIAEITFYGTDQVGTTIEARGTISVSFGDYADPAS
jgi:hypothetical protein